MYRLMQRWADDIRAGIFDGNDGDDRTSGTGLQLGSCPPIAPGCVVSSARCATGQCHRLCDLYSGTPRVLLAGAMVKVIGDRGPGGLNQTGLDVSDALPIVRSVADDMDPDLFDESSCVEDLDRVPPSLRFDVPTPGESALVRGTIQLKATAVDDLDPSPDTSLLGVVDLDGDPANAVALTTIDTAALADGPLRVSARAIDLAGNIATLERALVVDNTPPGVTLAATGFFVDGTTWWTASATPVLTGTIADTAPVSIKAVIPGGLETAGVVSGTTWTITLPPGALDAGGTPVQIVATDAAGNQRSVTQRLRPDLEPPVLSFLASPVNDETDESVAFAVDHSPRHAHTGAPVDLSTAMGCPSLTKFSYLLGSTTPEYALELPGPNPLQYQLVTDDPGVGIAAGSTEYRVVGLQPDWTSAGTGIPIGAGVTRFAAGIFSDAVPGLAEKEGIYAVEFHATDRLGRTTTVPRCFHLHLRAPPLELELEPPGSPPTKVHAYALDSLSLAPEAQYDQIAARLLNREEDGAGASLIDQDVFNGTTATVYLTATVTPPSRVTAAQSFVLQNAPTEVGDPMCSPCTNALKGPALDEPTPEASTPITTLHFPVKVFELVSGVPDMEIPCLAPCPLSGTVFKFAIPPRPSGGQPARAFRMMTMIGQVAALWPSNGTYVADPPFEDAVIEWTNRSGFMTITRLTGKVDHDNPPERFGCVIRDATSSQCEKTGTLVPYRALVSAKLTFSSQTSTLYATAAAADLAPAVVAQKYRPLMLGWATSEGTLPVDSLPVDSPP